VVVAGSLRPISAGRVEDRLGTDVDASKGGLDNSTTAPIERRFAKLNGRIRALPFGERGSTSLRQRSEGVLGEAAMGSGSAGINTWGFSEARDGVGPSRGARNRVLTR
jgi:hypothetical protein